MMVSNQGSFLGVLRWQWRYCLAFVASGAVAVVVHDVLAFEEAHLPPGPATVLGAALGIFASFRANAAYGRWWEGRQLWGRLVNASRMYASQCLAYLGDPELARRLVLRHALYVHVLRCQLRDDDPFADDHVKRLADQVGADEEALKGESSIGHALVDASLRELAGAPLDPMRLRSFDQSLMAFLDVQGGCERIKRTPMPRGYGFFVSRLLVIFAVLFPFTVVHELGWVVVPVNLLVCIGFTLISETGRVLEDPFTHFWNSLPLTSMSVNIERNVRQRLEDKQLPVPVVVDKDGILW
jgi:ion channel-forming bestrophin family protein